MTPLSAAERCAICGVSLSSVRAAQSVLCESLRCAHAHAALPSDQRCVHCTRPVPVANRASRQCGRSACAKATLFDGPLKAERARRAALRDKAIARRRRAGAQRGMSAAEIESYVLAIVPRNYDRLSRLPVRRARQFEAHLREQLAIARTRLAAGLPVEPVRSWDAKTRQLATHDLALLGAGCATCHGYCCRLGETHAFIRPDTMARYIERFPAKDDAAIVADYLGFLAPRTLSKGCVFQLADGCAMPREMRSDTCSDFLCDGLTRVHDELTQLRRAGEPDMRRAYYVNADGYQVRGGTFVDVDS